MKIEKFPDQLNSIFIRVDYIKNIDKEDKKKVLTDKKKKGKNSCFHAMKTF